MTPSSVAAASSASKMTPSSVAASSASLRVIVRPAARAASSSAPPLDSPMLSGLSNSLTHASMVSPVPLEEPASAGRLSPTKRKSADLSQTDEASASTDRPESPLKRRSLARAARPQRPQPTTPTVTVVDVFSPGMLRSPVFRIPALLALPDGSVLAFSEARPELHDAGIIDLVLRRSADNGRTWGPAQIIVDGAALGMARSATVGNPAPCYDASTDTIHLLLCSNHQHDAEWQIHAREGKDTRRVWVTSSKDGGRAWSAPREITRAVKRPGWTWYATGPGAGVQLRSGRLLVPCNHAEDVAEPDHPYLVAQRRSRMVAHAVYSDDHGATWRLGGVGPNHTNEAALAELADGSVMLNARDWSGRFVRRVSRSTDGGASWDDGRHDATLVEPVPQGCQGSLLGVVRGRPPGQAKPRREDEALAPGGGGVLFFCNPASSERREMLTVRRSDDGGATWGASLVVEEGPSAYSALQLLANGRLGVLYERADRISFATIPSHPDGPLGAFS